MWCLLALSCVWCAGPQLLVQSVCASPPVQREEWRAKGHGQYTEIAEEKEFFEECKKNDKVVCHFYRSSTWRCKVVDKHLALLAPRHLETRFLKLSVDRAPFLCQRLNIRILPSIGIVVDGKTKEFIKGKAGEREHLLAGLCPTPCVFLQGLMT